MRLRNAILIATGLTIALPALGGSSDVKPASPQQNHTESTAPTIQVYSRETIVDVTVTDDKGNPVHGLQQSDFTLEENGKPQSIRSFKEFGVEPPAPARSLPRLPPGVYTNYQAAPTTGPVNIMLIDAFHSNFQLMEYEKKAILEYLQKMPDGTQVAIFWLSESGLHLLQGFTSDRAALERATNTARYDIGTNMTRWTRQWYTIDAFDQLAEYVASIKGRKNLLWFAPGMPVMLDRDGGYSWGDGDMGRVHRLMDAYELLSAEQVAIYPIDPSGPGPMGFAQLRAEEVAEDSGGMALYNSNDITGLINKAIDHGSHFYTLSYVPPSRKDDGHFHTIKVEVNQPGLHLVYRKGYNAEELPHGAPSPGSDLMKASMEGNAPTATQLLFDIELLPGTNAVTQPPPNADTLRTKSPSLKTSVPYDVVFLLPQSQIAFTDNADGTHAGALEFDVAAYDNNRKLISLISQTMKLPLTSDEYQQFVKTPFKFSEKLELPPGPITLRAGILDTVSNKVGTLEVPLVVMTRQQITSAVPAVTPPPCPPRCALPTPTPPPATSTR